MIDGQLRPEILVPRAVFRRFHNRPAARREAVLERLGKPHAVILLHIGQHRHVLPPFRKREFRHHLPLERIDEADPENVIAHLRHLRVGRSRRDHRHVVFLADRRRLERFGRGHLPEHRDHVILGDQLARDGRGLPLHRPVVLRDQIDLLPQHPAGRVDFINRQRRAVMGGLAETGAPPDIDANSPTLI